VTEQTRGENTRATEERPLSPVAVTASSPRSRLDQALLCPYCRDTVTRRGTVACARRGCGALYHRDCWQEVVSSYGGCAIYGCESKKAKEVSAAGWVIKMVRLILAGVLLPRRLARAIRKTEGVGFGTILKDAFSRARGVGRILGLCACVLVVVFSLVWRLAHGRFDIFEVDRWESTAFSWAFWTPMIAVFLGSVIFYVCKAVGIALKSELAALARADDPESTPLGRLHRGSSEKK
jgi:hypothetical protein